MRAACLIVLLMVAICSAQPMVSWAEENQRLASASVSIQGGSYLVQLFMDDDNGNAGLPNSYRRWWHCRLDGLSGGQVLNVRIEDPGYVDIILPTWSLSTDGVNFGPWTRLPGSSTPVYSGGRHSFTVVVPPGVTALRLAKYFPYTVSDKDAYLQGLAGSTAVRSVDVLGMSWQGRPIEMVELTDASVPDAGKRRVWVHSGIPPAENTSYWVVEGLMDFLGSGEPAAAALLRELVIDVVPMANPDGVFLGNYRTNAVSVNLETQWAAPYQSAQPEIQAMQARMEAFMGTAASPGANPVDVVLNLHATHGSAWPYHFRHAANGSWNPTTSPSGVLPSVNVLETAWIDAFKGRSPFVSLGTTQSSSCGSPVRPYIECMMHDRWSADPQWTGAPAMQGQVMAITFEGTYGPSPSGPWNTPDDWRQVGRELGLALGDYLGVLPSYLVTDLDPSPCGGATSLSLTVISSGSNWSGLFIASGAPPGANGWLLFSPGLVNIPLPPTSCPLRVWPDVFLPMPVYPAGQAFLQLPATPGLSVDINAQFVAESWSGGGYAYYPSNALRVQLAW